MNIQNKIPINPKLPARFSDTPNDQRPASHDRWWHKPFIETDTWAEMDNPKTTAVRRAEWFAAWPSGTRFDVRCLDGGAWDRPTCWGMFGTLEEAIQCAASGGLFGKTITGG